MRLNDESLEYAMDITDCCGVISNGKIFHVPTLLEEELLKEIYQDIKSLNTREKIETVYKFLKALKVE